MIVTHFQEFEEINPVSLLYQFQWLTAKTLAKYLGVSQASVSTWGGKKPCEPRPAVKRLAYQLQKLLKQWVCPFPPPLKTEKLAPLELLKKYKISRSKLAEMLGVTLITVNRWACGKRQPSPSIQRLAWELDRRWSELNEKQIA
ncbi:MAG: helix-turn-helix domain-containing protein [Okeania sp. SIO1H6]|nr:helix-turn-helix domain-containing protein [Okeania sp. SIO1H6]